MARMAAESAQNHTAIMSSIRASDTARGRPGRRPSYSSDTNTREHPLVRMVEDGGYSDFGFMVFRTDFSNEGRWRRFVEQWDGLVGARIEAAAEEEEDGERTGSGSGLGRVVDKVYMKIVDDEEAMRGKGVNDVVMYVVVPFLLPSFIRCYLVLLLHQVLN